MNDAIRAVIGSLLGALAMFAVGFVFWGSPLMKIAYAGASEQQNAAVQLALAANLPHTGRYIVPDPNTRGGTVLYGKGPIATIDYNTSGFSTADPSAMVGGYVQEVVVSLMIAFSLFAVAGRVTDFESRFRLAVGLTSAATVMIALSDPIFGHTGWGFAIYNVVADSTMLAASAFVITRWFLPIAPASTLKA